jgi:CHASE2 domain-containing sensor protein/serine phosphatase RsbU (regulator of sigma subunit)
VNSSPGSEPASSSPTRIRNIGVVVLAALAGLLWWEPSWLLRGEAAWFDAYQNRAPRRLESSPAVIVAIDDKSIAKLGQWPWPRTALALLIVKIASARPAAIGIDILMPEPDRLSPQWLLGHAEHVDADLAARLAALPSNDAELARVMAAVPVVLALAGTTEPSGVVLRAPPITVHDAMARGGTAPQRTGAVRFAGVIGSVDEIDRAAAGRGLISVVPTRGVVRRVPLVFDVNGTLAPALAVEMLRVAQGAPALRLATLGASITHIAAGSWSTATERDGAVRVYYSHHDDGRYVSALDVLEGKVDPATLRQKLVLIGTNGLGLADDQTTPLGEAIPGIEVQAQLLENLVDHTVLQRPIWARPLELALFLSMGALLIYATPRLPPRNSALLVLGCVVVLAGAGFVAFRLERVLFDAATPAVALIVLFGVLLGLALREATRQKGRLERIVRTTREQAARMSGELEAAQRVQTAMLPPVDLLRDDHRVELAAAMYPAREVGGDLYDFYPLDRDRLLFLIGDVAGKGLSASIFMAVGKALYKSVALRAHDPDVGVLMSSANVEISRDNPEMLFVTAFVGILDLETGELAYCNAGHENPYLLPRGPGQMRLIEDGDGPPLCAVDAFAYREARRRMHPGEMLCLVTDGLVDTSNAKGELFGRQRIETRLAELAEQRASPKTIVDGLCADANAFAAGVEAPDDLTVLALRWNGPRGALVASGV